MSCKGSATLCELCINGSCFGTLSFTPHSLTPINQSIINQPANHLIKKVGNDRMSDIANITNIDIKGLCKIMVKNFQIANEDLLINLLFYSIKALWDKTKDS